MNATTSRFAERGHPYNDNSVAGLLLLRTAAAAGVPLLVSQHAAVPPLATSNNPLPPPKKSLANGIIVIWPRARLPLASRFKPIIRPCQPPHLCYTSALNKGARPA